MPLIIYSDIFFGQEQPQFDVFIPTFYCTDTCMGNVTQNWIRNSFISGLCILNE